MPCEHVAAGIAANHAKGACRSCYNAARRAVRVPETYVERKNRRISRSQFADARGYGAGRDRTDARVGAWTLDADDAEVATLAALPVAVLVGADVWAQAEQWTGNAREEHGA